MLNANSNAFETADVSFRDLAQGLVGTNHVDSKGS